MMMKTWKFYLLIEKAYKSQAKSLVNRYEDGLKIIDFRKSKLERKMK
jgi:hypothetical protein